MAAGNVVTLPSFDAAYLRALYKGDPETEHHFVNYFTPAINRKLRKYLHMPELIQEAAQETFVRVLAVVRTRKGLRHPERFGAFVHAVCRNVALETWRRERRFVALEEVDHAETPFRSPHSTAEALEARDHVRKFLAHLSTSDRQLLEAIFLKEEDRLRLCRRLGVTSGHLRVLVHRAKRRCLGHALASETTKL